jgi:hypothetical protein
MMRKEAINNINKSGILYFEKTNKSGNCTSKFNKDSSGRILKEGMDTVF